VIADVAGLLGIQAAAFWMSLGTYVLSSRLYQSDDRGYARASIVDGSLSRIAYVADREDYLLTWFEKLARLELVASVAVYLVSRAALPPIGSFMLSCLVSLAFAVWLMLAARYSAWESYTRATFQQRVQQERSDEQARLARERREQADRRRAAEQAEEERRKAEDDTIRRAREIRAAHRRQQELQRAEAIVRAHEEGRLDDFERERDYPTNWSSIREAVLARDGYKCANCGVQAGPNVTLHVHHVVPLSLGGTNNLTNLTTLCERCHKSLHPHMR
jgi:hypothetical protein